VPLHTTRHPVGHESHKDRRRQRPKAGPDLMREKFGFGGICQGMIGTGCPHVKEDWSVASSLTNLFDLCVARAYFWGLGMW